MYKELRVEGRMMPESEERLQATWLCGLQPWRRCGGKVLAVCFCTGHNAFNPLALGDHTPGASHPHSTSLVLPEPHSAGDSADSQFEDTVKAVQFSSHSC